MSTFDDLPNQESLRLMEEVSELVLDEPISPTNNRPVCIFYGSSVLNSMKSESDVDMMVVHPSITGEPHRLQRSHQGRPVSIYNVTTSVIADDGADFNYGGYFTGKLLSPNVIKSGDQGSIDSVKKVSYSSVGSFISNFLRLDENRDYTEREISGEVFGSYLRLYPAYATYILKFFASTIDDDTLSDLLIGHSTSCLESAGVIAATGNDGKFQVTSGASRSEEEVKDSSYRATHRFWSYGAVSHSGNHAFVDYYIDKAMSQRKDIDPTGTRWLDIKERLGIVE